MNIFFTAFFSVLSILAAILLLCFWLWRYKISSEGSIFTFSRDGLEEQSEKIREVLKKLKTSDRSASQALLILEEIMMRLNDHTNQVITARIKRKWGKTFILLTASGQAYNPLDEFEASDDSEDSIRNRIFSASHKNLTYKYRLNKNFIRLQVR